MQPQPPSLAQNVQHASVVEHAVLSGTHWLPLPLPMLQNVALHCVAHVPHVQPDHAFHSSIAFCDAASPQFAMHAALMLAHLFTQSLSFEHSESPVQTFPLAWHRQTHLARVGHARVLAELFALGAAVGATTVVAAAARDGHHESESESEPDDGG